MKCFIKYCLSFLIIILFILIHLIPLVKSSPQKMLKQSQQMLLVTTKDWSDINGQLQRYERQFASQDWQIVGKPIPVVVGKKGMAWGVDTPSTSRVIEKREGDGRTPVGIFKIGPLFGFNKHGDSLYQLDYVPLIATSICVDDEKSRYYNQFIDSQTIKKIDWRSGEAMSTISAYEFGAVIQYNQHPVRSNAGSCIFLHRWKDKGQGTAGCIAMADNNLRDILMWLNGTKNPVFISMTMPAYALLPLSLKKQIPIQLLKSQ